MSWKLPNGDISRNPYEQILDNKEQILRHFQEGKVLGDFGIRVIGRLDEWNEEETPTGPFEFGDAYAVGPVGGPFVFYIWTRGNPDYWFDYGAISIVGPQGPAGEGEKGETGESTRWWSSKENMPIGSNIKVGDQWLQTSTGNVYQYSETGAWQLTGNIKGANGTNGVSITNAYVSGTGNLVIQYSNGEAQTLGNVKGKDGTNGRDGYTTITHVIGSLPEGSIISDTYNPATQPDNATILMPVNGQTHAFVIIDGNWVDAGPYSGGSSIYSNNQFIQEYNIDQKLSIPNHPYDLVSAVSLLENGTPTAIPVVQGTLGNSIPLRDLEGGIIVPDTPASSSHATSKLYVDTLLADSDTITTMWENDKLTANLNADLVAQLNRAILTPLTNPTKTQVPTISTTGAINYAPYNQNSITSLSANTQLPITTYFINGTKITIYMSTITTGPNPAVGNLTITGTNYGNKTYTDVAKVEAFTHNNLIFFTIYTANGVQITTIGRTDSVIVRFNKAVMVITQPILY